MPIDMEGADSFLKKVYQPALEQQLNREKLLLSKMAPPILTRRQRIKSWYNEKCYRMKDAYDHLKYGYCDQD